ncbi:MAG: pyridoxal phosphate-dependent aminotransferase [Magnetococcus sp. DMHC-6]
MNRLAKRIQNVKPSPTLMITAKAKTLQAQGRDVIGLGSGEPDFDTPKHIKKAAIQALKEGFTKYTAVDGIPELKKAIVAKFAADNELTYTPNQVVVTVGGKQAFYNMAQAIIEAGDEVIIPAPYWVSYPDMIYLAEGTPVIVQTSEEKGFKLTPEQLEKAITPKTRLLVLNSPSNPTGATYQKEELGELGEVLLKHPQVLIVTDDIYEKIIFDRMRFYNLPQVVPALKDRCVVLNGFSKSYSMTGWRLGYAAGPEYIIKAMVMIQSQSTSNPTSFVQRGAVAALTGSQKCMEPMLRAFHERREFVVKSFNAMPGMHCFPPKGAFYAYPNIEGLLGKTAPDGKVIANSLDLADMLLDHYDVAIVPGIAFGQDPYFRISFATSMTDLERAMKRIHLAAEKLMGKG